jgi:plasmid stabilization system protein ParE
MAVKRIEIHPSALSELKSAISWYMERSETAALNFASASETAIAQIVASPQRWPNHEHGTRRFVLQRFPYAIVYRERALTIQIVAIPHARRRPGYWKDRD